MYTNNLKGSFLRNSGSELNAIQEVLANFKKIRQSQPILQIPICLAQDIIDHEVAFSYRSVWSY